MENKKSHIQIIDQLTLGLSSLSSLDDYKKLIKEFPNEPRLYRLLADYLSSKKAFIEASKTYRKTYHLFMQQGMSLQAIAALMCTWSIVKPSPYDLRSLHSRLKRKDSHTSAIAECFAKMSYPELVDVLSLVNLELYNSGEYVKKTGSPDDALYLVVSGELTESLTEDDPENIDPKLLIENDFFGCLIPREKKKDFSSYIRAETRVELLKITNENLLSLCGEHPDFETGLKNLNDSKSLPDEDKPSKFFRKSSRQELSIILNLEIFGREPGLTSINVKGYSSDISLGGACVIVDPKYQDIPEDLAGRNAKIRISLPGETVALAIMGRLAWHKITSIANVRTSAIGVQFNEMPPKVRGLLIVFANAVGTMTRLLDEGGFSQDSIETRSK
ncbi:MAG: cyclic nucleotide-binding domain-containing protein [Proteobacteria bacterium]|nr:cyclic nucleotide-binding domain-containing protein [Pseudomonadota bacterium]MBU1738597.1 cyclic nucleotide-binding domain-containing protein [Pseudomonadota bacterium]